MDLFLFTLFLSFLLASTYYNIISHFLVRTKYRKIYFENASCARHHAIKYQHCDARKKD